MSDMDLGDQLGQDGQPTPQRPLTRAEEDAQVVWKTLRTVGLILLALFILYSWTHPSADTDPANQTAPCTYTDESGC